MAKLLAPQGVDQVTVETQNFQVDSDHKVEVPDIFIPKLLDIGFKQGPFKIEVSEETAEAIKNTAKSARVKVD